MKLFDDKGKFQFIKNEQVEIDNNLLKWKFINSIKKAKEEKSITESEPISIENSISGISISSVDDLIETEISDLDKDKLIPFLNEETAKKFNEEFFALFNAEVNINKYSTSITSSRWDYSYDTPNIILEDKKPSKISSIWQRFNNVFTNLAPKNEDKIAHLTVAEFFRQIKILASNKDKFIERISEKLMLIKNATMMGQKAQVDLLCQKIIIDIYESVLATNGYNKYIKFSDLAGLNCPGKKVIDIDYVKNYNRVIPNDVVQKKLKADLFQVFDNYCIMYYDPSGSTYRAPEKDRRDPILFGLINHSDKLYYIADWEDEYCDLSLDKIIEQIKVEELK